jgi:hypothetical protein
MSDPPAAHHASAVLIQAALFGHWTRRWLSRALGGACATRIQSAWKGHLVRAWLHHWSTHRAAATIQAAWQGHLVRAAAELQVAAKPAALEQVSRPADAASAAATCIEHPQQSLRTPVVVRAEGAVRRQLSMSCSKQRTEAACRAGFEGMAALVTEVLGSETWLRMARPCPLAPSARVASAAAQLTSSARRQSGEQRARRVGGGAHAAPHGGRAAPPRHQPVRLAAPAQGQRGGGAELAPRRRTPPVADGFGAAARGGEAAAPVPRSRHRAATDRPAARAPHAEAQRATAS